MGEGFFISIEGIEGVGKSTAMQTLQQHFHKTGEDVVFTREPGGTPVAESIRLTLATEHDEPMHADTELLLMFASRAQHISTVIAPALAAGKTVICDRFIDSSYAYQGGGRGIPLERIAVLDHWLQPRFVPNMTLLLDAPVEVGQARMAGRATKDRIESERAEFFERVRDTYLARAQQYKDRFQVIDASKSLELVQKEIINSIDQLIHA